jgi:8-oxo-dGTP diphosphatase
LAFEEVSAERDVYSDFMGKERDSSSMDFGIRVGAVAERDGALLLVRHEKQDQDPYWVLPGGRLEPGETIPDCAERELLEETGLEGRFVNVLYVSEFFDEDRHTVDVTARVEARGGEARLGSDPEVEEGSEATLKEVRWVETGKLAEVQLLPDRVKERLLADAARGWPAGKVYLEGRTDA